VVQPKAEKWNLFGKRYFTELDEHLGAIGQIMKIARKGTVTLVYGSKRERYNNVVALKEYVDAKMAAVGRKVAA
jgi:hypothetical protein